MTENKIRQTLLGLSALFLMNYILLKNSRDDFLSLYAESIFASGFTISLSETCPLLFWEENQLTEKKVVSSLIKYVREEVFPAADYIANHWEDKAGFLRTEENLPSYYLETDEEKIELPQEVEIQDTEENAQFYKESQLEDYSFLLKHFYVVDSTTSVAAGELNGAELAKKDLSIELQSDSPKVLIYHTHGSEAFADSKGSGKEETIIGIGDELARILEEKYKIKTYHDRSFYDMIQGSLDRSKAYTYAGNGIKRILEKYPSIEVIIDLHRDAVKEGTRLVTDINGKKTAKIMFFNGLSRTAKNGDISYLKNPYKEENLAFSLQMQLAAAEYYPGFTRKIYLKGYRYNLHLKPRSLLIEVGAQTNTKEEAKNAMEPLGKLLYEVLKQK